ALARHDRRGAPGAQSGRDGRQEQRLRLGRLRHRRRRGHRLDATTRRPGRRRARGAPIPEDWPGGDRLTARTDEAGPKGLPLREPLRVNRHWSTPATDLEPVGGEEAKVTRRLCSAFPRKKSACTAAAGQPPVYLVRVASRATARKVDGTWRGANRSSPPTR